MNPTVRCLLSRVQNLLLIAFTTLGFVSISARPAWATGTKFYIVTVATDTTLGITTDCTDQLLPGATPDSNCSLRDAIAAANATPTIFSEIEFTSTLGSVGSPGVMTLANGPLAVTAASVTITGLGATSLALDGGGVSSILNVGTGVTLSISGLKFQNAHGTSAQSGGAIYNAGFLTLMAVQVIGNQPSQYSGGAGIYNEGDLLIFESTITGNSSSYFGGDSGQGGGILSHGPMTITNTTFGGNGASLGGGNIYTDTGAVVIRNTTITGSDGTQNAGGMFVGGGTVTVIDSTISGNGAGRNSGVDVNGGSATFTNSIVAGNSSVTGNCTGCTLLTGNVVDVTPLLSVIGDYGGATQTMVPFPNSPAICAGVVTVDTTDERGFARPTGSCYDVGAVQTAYSMSFQASPSNTPVGATLSPIPDVTVLDHNTIGVPGIEIAVALNGPGTLSGTSPEPSNGEGNTSYADLSVNAVGTGDTLTATVGGLTAVSNPFNITPLTPTVTFVPNPASQVYGTAIAAGSLDATASYGGGPIAGPFSYTTTINSTPNQAVTAGVTVLPAATYTITATITPTNTNYGPASATAMYTVTAITPTLTFAAIPTHNYGDAPFPVSATSASSGTVTYSVTSGPATINGNTVTLTGSGTVYLHASQAAAGNYGVATADTSFVVNSETPTLVFATIPQHTYGDAPFAVSATSASSGAVTYSVTSGPATISGNTVTLIGGGSVMLGASQAASAGYNSTSASTSFSVLRQATADTASASSSTAAPFQSITLTAAVAAVKIGQPTGTVTFYDNGTQIGAATNLNGGVAQLQTTALTPGQANVITFSYGGDMNFLPALATASVPTTITVVPQDFNFSGASQFSTVVPGGSAVYSFALSPQYGVYPGTVAFSASGAPANATLTFAPTSVAANGGAQTVSLTVQTPALASRETPSWPQDTTIVLACLVLPFLGSKRKLLQRAGGRTRLLLLLLLSLGVTVGLSGCGAGKGFLSEPVQNYSIAVTATSGTVQHTVTVTMQVQ